MDIPSLPPLTAYRIGNMNNPPLPALRAPKDSAKDKLKLSLGTPASPA
jgi:hypothetical protein